MKNIEKFIKIILNVQILSALIWAAVIIGCSYVSDNQNISAILITAAGFHVILLSKFSKNPSSPECQVVK